MLAANEAVAEHIESAGVPSIYRIHEQPDPKRVMEFEEVATHFGYTLGVGAIPVKKFGYRKEAGWQQGKARDRAAGGRDEDFAAEIIRSWWRRSRASRKKDPELPDAAVVEAGALQRGEHGAFRAGGVALYAFHVTDPAVSGSDGASGLGALMDGGKGTAMKTEMNALPRIVPSRSVGRRRRSGTWWSGRK